MTQARRMIETNPSGFAVDAEALAECIEACFDCVQACTACAGTWNESSINFSSALTFPESHSTVQDIHAPR